MVREAVHIESGHKVAIKIYDKYKLNKNTQMKRGVLREIQILSLIHSQHTDGVKKNKITVTSLSLDSEETSRRKQGYDFSKGHPNIMKMYDAIDTQRQLYLVLELCKGDILEDVIKRSTQKHLSERNCAKILEQIMNAMSYYHGLNISHRDIKLENILVDMDSEDLTTKVIDFGFATQTKTANELIKTCCGTPSYMSPELCMRDEYIGPAVDIWAAGVVLYTLLFGTQPWKGKTEDDLFKKITKGVITFPKSINRGETSKNLDLLVNLEKTLRKK